MLVGVYIIDQNLNNLHCSIMSFRRKWMSDTNLSKLLHETIEKKEANKQSKLPDFCKDAILSATIKRISSALVVDDNQHSGVKKLSGYAESECSFVEDKALTNDDAVKHTLSPSVHSINQVSMTFQESEQCIENMDVHERVFMKSSVSSDWAMSNANTTQSEQCFSPKRKRQPSSEGLESSFTEMSIVSSSISPMKKRREEFSNSISSCNNSLTDKLSKNCIPSPNAVNLGNEHFREHRSQSLPHLTSFIDQDNILLSSKTNSISSKSVVSSISELSINDCWKSETNSSSWCFSNCETVESDPLELNGFFQELKSVTVHPN